MLYLEDRGVAKDPERARELLSVAAEKGEAKAQNNLGLLYVRGEGVAQDYEKAVALFRQAVEQGLKPAVGNLGVMYENGFGVPLSETKVFDLYRRSGRSDARISDDFDPDEIPAVYDSRLAPPYSGGWTLESYRRAAARGDVVSAFLLSYIHARGLGVPVDYSKAAGFYRQAASAGFVPAVTNLDLLSFRGRGMPQDFVTAYMWLNLASAGGHAEAVKLRAALKARMTADQINEAQKLASGRWAATGVRSVGNGLQSAAKSPVKREDSKIPQGN